MADHTAPTLDCGGKPYCPNTGLTRTVVANHTASTLDLPRPWWQTILRQHWTDKADHTATVLADHTAPTLDCGGKPYCPANTGLTKTVVADQHRTVIGETHTPRIAFWHLPPNSARISYATEGALFISAQLSSDAVSALRKVWVLI